MLLRTRLPAGYGPARRRTGGAAADAAAGWLRPGATQELVELLLLMQLRCCDKLLLPANQVTTRGHAHAHAQSRLPAGYGPRRREDWKQLQSRLPADYGARRRIQLLSRLLVW